MRDGKYSPLRGWCAAPTFSVGASTGANAHYCTARPHQTLFFKVSDAGHTQIKLKCSRLNSLQTLLQKGNISLSTKSISVGTSGSKYVSEYVGIQCSTLIGTVPGLRLIRRFKNFLSPSIVND